MTGHKRFRKKTGALAPKARGSALYSGTYLCYLGTVPRASPKTWAEAWSLGVTFVL